MKVSVALVVFARNAEYPANPYILMWEREEGLFSLPQSVLPEDQDSITVANNLFEDCSRVRGRWSGLTEIVQIGIFDDVNRNQGEREILIVYGVYLAAQTVVFKDYKWVTLDKLTEIRTYLDTYHIIRFAALKR